MIWTRGEVIPEEALRVSVLDRTFEHGLGLFETLRTWNGHPTLFSRHLERLRRSARELDLPLEAGQLPDLRAVSELLQAGALPPGQDVRLRITLTGGREAADSFGDRSTLWMTAGPLPPPIRSTGAILARSILVDPSDPLARHKTLNYWRKRIAHSEALEEGADEVLCATPDGLVWEGTRSNLFLVAGHRLLTPGADGPLLPGIMRRVVLDHAERLGLEVIQGPVSMAALAGADEAFLTNSVRGMLPIGRLPGADLPAPGPVTRQLWGDIVSWLESGGTPP